MNYGTGQSVCPQCGSGTDVRTVAELFDMLSGGARGGASQQGYPGQQAGPGSQGTCPDYPAQGYQAPSDQDPGNQGPSNQGPGNQSSDSTDTSSDQPYQSYQGPGFPSQPYQSPSNQGSDRSGTSSDQPYQSYQGPGFPNQPYQGQSSGPAPGYQGPDYPTASDAARRYGVFDDRFRKSLAPCSGRPCSPAGHRQADAEGLRGAHRSGDRG